MDKCFASCSCEDYEGLTKADLDRYTDKIENVLNDAKGRKLFRNFMYTSKMKDGRRAMDFYEHLENILDYRESAKNMSYRNFLREVDELIESSERIEELDFAVMERLTIARDSEDREKLDEALKSLKADTTRVMAREYAAFRKHFIAMK